jgi:hypothetical protein
MEIEMNKALDKNAVSNINNAMSEERIVEFLKNKTGKK